MRSLPSAVPDSANPDVVLVGGGIMSATLAALIGVVAPQWSVTVFESAADVAGESSQRAEWPVPASVSYTHLTLPTKA